MLQVDDRRVPYLVPRVEELVCECGQPGCDALLPLAAERYRGGNGRLLVAPGHSGLQTVVAAADRFFVVQPQRTETS
jgi:hypothetical protein